MAELMICSPPVVPGIRVLLVDDSPTCRFVVERMLISCHYIVTTCDSGEAALAMLRENRNGFDVVITDVYMPNMDGLALLGHITLEMDLPVLMISSDTRPSVMVSGLKQGALFFVPKPASMNSLKNIWQHVLWWRRRRAIMPLSEEESSRVSITSLGEEVDSKLEEVAECCCDDSQEERPKWKMTDQEIEERLEYLRKRKPRLLWDVALHEKFLNAIAKLGGVNKAVPKAIHGEMKVPGLTRGNIASHLQKFRLQVRQHEQRKLQHLKQCIANNIPWDQQPSSSTGSTPSNSLKLVINQNAAKSKEMAEFYKDSTSNHVFNHGNPEKLEVPVFNFGGYNNLLNTGGNAGSKKNLHPWHNPLTSPSGFEASSSIGTIPNAMNREKQIQAQRTASPLPAIGSCIYNDRSCTNIPSFVASLNIEQPANSCFNNRVEGNSTFQNPATSTLGCSGSNSGLFPHDFVHPSWMPTNQFEVWTPIVPLEFGQGEAAKEVAALDTTDICAEDEARTFAAPIASSEYLQIFDDPLQLGNVIPNFHQMGSSGDHREAPEFETPAVPTQFSDDDILNMILD